MVSLSLPSLRADSFTRELMDKVASIRNSTITFAPETYQIQVLIDGEEQEPAEAEYYLVGYLNSEDYTGNDYKFVDGKLTVTYKLVSNEIKVSSEFLTVIPALEDVTTVDQEAFTAYAFGEEIDMKAVLGDSTTALIYICNVVDYNTGMDGVSVKVM